MNVAVWPQAAERPRLAAPILRVRGLSKTFILHERGGQVLPVFSGVNLDLAPGECVALSGPSGCGKSSLMRCLSGNYEATSGRIEIQTSSGWHDLSRAEPREWLALRRSTIGHVSQFLRVVPRVSTLDIVTEPLRRLGLPDAVARHRAVHWLVSLNLDERLWGLPPARFSGGEQQRVNVARGLISSPAVLLLDEPTASLDAANAAIVVDRILAAREAGAAIVGIFHDPAVRKAVATRELDLHAHHA